VVELVEAVGIEPTLTTFSIPFPVSKLPYLATGWVVSLFIPVRTNLYQFAPYVDTIWTPEPSSSE